MASYDFVWLDVFTDRPLGGNPLPVVFDPDQSLTDAQMLAVARELNTSETTFVVPPRDTRATLRLRCFSTTAEVFGAGHNALGAWWAIVDRGAAPAGEGETELRQELGDRVLPLTVVRENGQLRRITMRQSPPEIAAGAPDRTALAAALSLDPSALDVAGLDPQVISTGARHLLVPARTIADLGRVRVDPERLVGLARPFGCHGCYLFCLETLDGRTDNTEPTKLTERGEPIGALAAGTRSGADTQSGGDTRSPRPGGGRAVARARAFGPGIGIAEDPATGSAAGPLAAYLVARRLAPQGEWLTIEQGYDMGRPSRIDVRVEGDRVEVAGRCVTVLKGKLTV